MRVTANVSNRENEHRASVSTDGVETSMAIPPRQSGLGSSVNGGELLCLALATCFCNDVYREAAKRAITVFSVDVEVESDFGGPGDPAGNVSYRVRVTADVPEQEIQDLIQHTDTVAEIQNTLRRPIQVMLAASTSVSTRVEARET